MFLSGQEMQQALEDLKDHSCKVQNDFDVLQSQHIKLVQEHTESAQAFDTKCHQLETKEHEIEKLRNDLIFFRTKVGLIGRIYTYSHQFEHLVG